MQKIKYGACKTGLPIFYDCRTNGLLHSKNSMLRENTLYRMRNEFVSLRLLSTYGNATSGINMH